MIGEDGAQPVMFQQIAEYHAPRWPDPAYPQQFHLDVTVDDVDAAEAAVLKLGATCAVLRRGELAGLRRPGRQAVLPLLGLAPAADARSASAPLHGDLMRRARQRAAAGLRGLAGRARITRDPASRRKAGQVAGRPRVELAGVSRSTRAGRTRRGWPTVV